MIFFSLIIGFVQDVTGNIKLVYVFFGVAAVVATVLLVLLTIGLRRRRGRGTPESEGERVEMNISQEHLEDC